VKKKDSLGKNKSQYFDASAQPRGCLNKLAMGRSFEKIINVWEIAEIFLSARKRL
jgi:hypothetical protein